MKDNVHSMALWRPLVMAALLWFMGQWAAHLAAQTPDSVPSPAPLGGVAPAPLPEPAAGEAAAPEPASKAGMQSTIPTLNLWSIMQKGGPVMWPIAACSFILLVFMFERTISLRTSRVIPRPFVQRFINQLRDGQLDREQALGLCEGNQSPVAEVFGAAVKKWGKPAVEVEQAIIDTGERVANNLRRYIRVFNAIYTVGPLLGLLGTVMGMIITFNQVGTSSAGERHQDLALGISQALLTTAFGLVVAIPGLFAYMYFISRVDRLIMEIDALGQRVVNAIASDGWRESSPRAGKSERRARVAKAMAATTTSDDEDDDE